MSTSLHSLALAALVAVTVGCSSPLTELVVRVDSNAATTPEGGPLESVRVRVEYDVTHATIFDRTVTFNGARSIPGDVGIVANDPDEARRIHVVVTASFTGSAPVVREFSLRFQPRRTVVLDAWIDGGCRTRSTPCPQGYTCGHDALCEGVTDPRLSDLTPIVDAGRRVTDTALDVTNDLPRDATNDLPTDVANDLPRDVITDVPTDVLNDVPMDAPRDAVDDLPRDVVRSDAVATEAGSPDVVVDVPVDVPSPLNAPRLIAPLSTSTVTSRQPTFEWTAVTGASGYTLQICDDRTCLGARSFPTTATQLTIPGTSPLERGTHFWRVIATRAAAPTASEPSRVWQFYAPLPSTPTWSLDSSWGSLPDFTGDGLSELVVGAWGGAQGHAVVFYGTPGGAPGSGSPLFTILAGDTMSPPTSFASATASAGDVNGDGLADLAVGEPIYSAGTGRVVIFYGRPGALLMEPSQTLGPGAPTALASFGDALSTAGDVNHDGYADLLVGASGTNGSTGRVYLFLGSAAGLMASPQVLDPPAAFGSGSRFGASVAGGGDLNGDRVPDFAVGAPNWNSTASSLTRAGAFVRIRGTIGSALRDMPQTPVYGTNSLHQLGETVRFVGDVLSDGRSDLVVGEPNANGTAGRVWLCPGGPPPTLPGCLAIDAPDREGRFGTTISGGGDINGDGMSEFAVGAPDYMGVGIAYVYSGVPSGMVPLLPRVQPLAGPARFGATVSLTGDLNGDTLADLVVTAVPTSGIGGVVRLYRGLAGGVTMAPLTTFVCPSGSTCARFGEALAMRTPWSPARCWWGVRGLCG